MRKNQKKLFFKIISLILFLGWLFTGGKNNNLLAQASTPITNTTPSFIPSQQIPTAQKNTDPFSPPENQIIISPKDTPQTPPPPKIKKAIKKQNSQQIKKPKSEIKIITLKKSSAVVTAYSSTVDQTDSTPFINAAGKRVRFGTVACNFLPLGTKIKFNNFYPQLIFVVEDRMNKRFNQRIDIWFPTRRQAKNFGRRKMDYQIVKTVK